MAKCETVKIQADSKGGFIVINAKDFDSTKHKLFVEKK